MMSHRVWLERILSVVGDLADERYQQRAWVRGSGTDADSFSEAINRLYDDYDFDGFIREASRAGTMPEDRLRALEALRRSLDRYLESVSDDDGRPILHGPEWRGIRDRARDVVAAFSRTAPVVP